MFVDKSVTESENGVLVISGKWIQLLHTAVTATMNCLRICHFMS